MDENPPREVDKSMRDWTDLVASAVLKCGLVMTRLPLDGYSNEKP